MLIEDCNPVKVGKVGPPCGQGQAIALHVCSWNSQISTEDISGSDINATLDRWVAKDNNINPVFIIFDNIESLALISKLNNNRPGIYITARSPNEDCLSIVRCHINGAMTKMLNNIFFESSHCNPFENIGKVEFMPRSWVWAII